MGAETHAASVALAELLFVNAPSQQPQHIADKDLLGRRRQRVAADLPANALQEAALAQDLEEFRRMGDGYAFALAYLGNGQARFGPSLAYLKQAAQAVFFVGGEFHR